MKLLAPLFCLVIWNATALASSFEVAKTTVTGADETLGDVVAELTRSAVTENGAHSIVPSNAEFVLQSKVIRVGNSYVISIAKVKDGRVLFSSQLKADKPDEFDIVVSRLVNSVLSEKKIGDTRKTNEVTEKEEIRAAPTREVRGRWYLGFGPMRGSAVRRPDITMINATLGRYWAIDSFEITSRVSLSSGTESFPEGFATFGLGLNKFLSDDDISPELGANFAYGTTMGSHNVNGFAADVTLGMRFFRTSSVQFDVALVGGMVFKDVLEYGKMPFEYGARIGILF